MSAHGWWGKPYRRSAILYCTNWHIVGEVPSHEPKTGVIETTRRSPHIS